MAKKKPTIPKILTIDGISYVLNRKATKGGFTSERVKNDPKMEKVRGNSTEFGHCSTVKRLLREGVEPFFGDYKDPTLHSRMMTLVTRIKDCDTQHEHGKRRVDAGLQTESGKRILQSFDFIPECKLFDHVLAKSHFDWDTQALTFPDLEMNTKMFGTAATHLELKLGLLHLDFENKSSTLTELSSFLFIPNMVKTTHVLKPDTPIDTKGMNMAVVGVQRYQVVNNVLYELYTKGSVGVKVLDFKMAL